MPENLYWQNKTVTILGLGHSGLACARELASLGCKLDPERQPPH